MMPAHGPAELAPGLSQGQKASTAASVRVSEEDAGKLVVAGGDAAEVLEAADGGLDPPPLAMAAPVVEAGVGAVAPSGDDRSGAGLAHGLAEAVGIVGALGDGPDLGATTAAGAIPRA